MLRQREKPDFLFGSAFVLLGIYVVFQAQKWAIYGHEGPGPGFFPIIYGGLMLTLGLALATKALRGTAVQAVPAREPDSAQPVLAVTTLAALAASLPLMWLFGFILGFGGVLFFIIKFIFHRPVLQSAIIAAVIAVSLHIGFVELLQGRLPSGIVWRF